MEDHKLKADYLLAAIVRDAKQSDEWVLDKRYFEVCQIHAFLKDTSPAYLQTFNQLAEHIASMNESDYAPKLRAAYDREGFPAALQKIWLMAIHYKPIIRANTLLDKLLGEAMPYLTGRHQFAPSDVPNTPELPSRELDK